MEPLDGEQIRTAIAVAADARNQLLRLIREGCGVEALSPAEERAKVDGLEKALAEVLAFRASLELADALAVGAEWRRMIGAASPED
jgi:hypothetical protein